MTSTAEEINAAFKEEAEGALEGILGVYRGAAGVDRLPGDRYSSSSTPRQWSLSAATW